MQKRLRFLIVGAILFAAALGPVAIVIAVRASQPQPIPTIPEAVPHRIVAFAEIAAGDFLEGRCTGLSVAKDIDRCFGGTQQRVRFPYESMTFDSFRRIDIPGQGGVPRVSWVIGFFVAEPAGESGTSKLWRLSVTVVESAAGGTLTYPVLGAAPTLLPRPQPESDQVAGADYAESPTLVDAVPTAITTQVSAWADAFARNDTEQLDLIVGDDNTDGIYLGLGGLSAERVNVLQAVDRGDGFWVVRARVVFTGTSANGWTSSNDYDLLIARPTTPDPSVVAWGSPGVGLALTPFSNNTAN
jgi:hypothetical protein